MDGVLKHAEEKEREEEKEEEEEREGGKGRGERRRGRLRAVDHTMWWLRSHLIYPGVH